MRIATLLLPAVIVALGGFLSFAAAEEPAPGSQTSQKLEVTTGTGDQAKKVELRYLLFLPAGYSAQGEPVPLMLFLHGAGERGDNLEAVKRHGPPKIVETKKDFPFLVISPQCPANERWQADELKQLVDDVAGKYRVDKSRMYVTGLSMGGYGSWAITSAYPDLFAAAMPICGGGDPAQAEKLVKLPIWVFHGDKDTAVPLSRSEDMVSAIKTAGGKDVKLTIYPGVGHDSWTATYNNQEVYDWLLAHRRDKSN